MEPRGGIQKRGLSCIHSAQKETATQIDAKVLQSRDLSGCIQRRRGVTVRRNRYHVDGCQLVQVQAGTVSDGNRRTGGRDCGADLRTDGESTNGIGGGQASAAERTPIDPVERTKDRVSCTGFQFEAIHGDHIGFRTVSCHNSVDQSNSDIHPEVRASTLEVKGCFITGGCPVVVVQLKRGS